MSYKHHKKKLILIRFVATLVCFVFIVTSPILVSHALASVVAYLIAHTNFLTIVILCIMILVTRLQNNCNMHKIAQQD